MFLSACNCNGYSNRCYFDQELFDRTGHGGYCLDCAANRAGPNCERCRDNYYERQDGVCIACNCNEIGESTEARPAPPRPSRRLRTLACWRAFVMVLFFFRQYQ